MAASGGGRASSADPGALPLRLDPLAGPPLEPIAAAPGGVVVLGRSAACTVTLADNAVSRRHASLQHGPDGWTLADLDSTHGTFLNGMKISPGTPAPVREGDVIAIGPWRFGVREGVLAPEGARSLMATLDDRAMAGARVQRIGADEVASLAQQRLGLIMECAAAIHSAADESALADGVLDAALTGTGYTRAALLRRVESAEIVEIVGQKVRGAGPSGQSPGAMFPLSRSLIGAAAAGQAVRLLDQPNLRQAHSIAGFGVEAAMCVPVEVNRALAGYLYLDAGAGSPRIQPDAAAFCTAVARMCGMALGNLERRKIERLQAQLMLDLKAARETQQRIMPPGKGAVGPVAYAMKSAPGRMVAGDLFDVVRLGPGRAAVFLGDVSGKGIGAAMLMATAQTELRAALREHNDVARAVTAANRYLVAHSAPHEFVTLWAGIFDAGEQTLHWVDAGHGYWLHSGADGALVRPATGTGLILGIDADHQYHAQRLNLTPGHRIMVFSDGVVEQPARSGDRFEMDRTLAALASNGSLEADVDGLFAAVVQFAGTEALADDVTIAALRFDPAGTEARA